MANFSVIFDMDGTLLDTQRICIPAWEYAGKKQGIDGMGQHIYALCGMNEVGWTKYLSDNFKTLDIPLFKTEMRDYIIREGKVRFMKGAEELLDFLKSNNIKIGIASGSSRASIDHHLKEVGATEYFDAIVSGKDVECGKPHPDIFSLTAEKLGVKPENCFVFEDSSNGVRAAYNANMKCIGVPDIMPFDDDVKLLLYLELENLGEAIKFFQKLL